MSFDLIAAKAEKGIYFLNRVTNYIAMLILLLIMFLVSGDIVGRFFNRPIYGTYELTSMGLGLIVFLSIGFTQLHKGHVAIEFLVNRWPRRVQGLLDTILYSIFTVMAALLAWQLCVHVRRLYTAREVSPDLTIPLYLFALPMAIGTIFFVISLLLDVQKSICKVVRKDES